MDFEFDILYAIQGLHNTALDKIMAFITRLGDVGFIWLLISAVLVVTSMICDKKGKEIVNHENAIKMRYMVFTMIIALLLEVFAVNICLKNIFNRLRPFQVDESIKMLITASGSSFPSGHTGSSFAAATAMSFFSKKAGVVGFILASLIGFSRMYFFVHFPTDVVGGIVVGCSCAFIAKAIMNKCVIKDYIRK